MPTDDAVGPGSAVEFDVVTVAGSPGEGRYSSGIEGVVARATLRADHPLIEVDFIVTGGTDDVLDAGEPPAAAAAIAH